MAYCKNVSQRLGNPLQETNKEDQNHRGKSKVPLQKKLANAKTKDLQETKVQIETKNQKKEKEKIAKEKKTATKTIPKTK